MDIIQISRHSDSCKVIHNQIQRSIQINTSLFPKERVQMTIYCLVEKDHHHRVGKELEEPILAVKFFGELATNKRNQIEVIYSAILSFKFQCKWMFTFLSSFQKVFKEIKTILTHNNNSNITTTTITAMCVIPAVFELVKNLMTSHWNSWSSYVSYLRYQ